MDDLQQTSKAVIAAAAEIITLRPYRNGSPLKIMRIKATREGTGDKKGRKRRAKGHLLEALISHLGLSAEETTTILRSLAARRELRFMKQRDCGLTISQCAALMLYLPVTARGLERLQRFVKWALPNSLGPSFLPSSLRKNLAKFSMDTFDLKLGFELVALEIGGSTRNRRCLHVWIREPAVAIQRLVQSALVAAKFERSLVFSNHIDELVVIQGSDRGGDITANLVRIGNRSGGNASQHCLPLSFYELGKESYFNLRQTIFNPHKPTRNFLIGLLEKNYHMITVTISNESGAVMDAQCSMLRFVVPSMSSGHRISLTRHPEDETAPIRAENQERALPPTVHIIDATDEESLRGSHDIASLSIQMIVSSAEEDDDIVHRGFILRNCLGRILLTEFFSEHLLAATEDTLSFNCLLVRGLTSDDIKCNTTLMGQGTASVMHPCTICVAGKKEFASYLTKPQDEQPANRAGDFANPKLYEDFVEAAKGRVDWVRNNSTGQAKTMKQKYLSVVFEPLLYTPPEANSCSDMHVSSGLLTHCTQRMLVHLAEIDKLTGWLDGLTAKLDNARVFINATKSSSEKLRKQDTKLVHDIQAAQLMGSAQISKQLEAEREILSLELMAVTKSRDAAKLFIEKGNDFVQGVAKKTKSRIMGPATYAFRKAYEVDGRVAFRVENSGFELSNADGIRVLERADKIINRMHKVFANNHNLVQLQKSVDTLMEKFALMTKLLYGMSVMMKSQRKWTTEACDEFESAARQYGEQWIAFTTTGEGGSDEATIFNKLHVLVTHLPQFVRQHGMLGRCSEEGFESSHKCIESVRKPLACMTSTEDRAHTIYRRTMLQSRPEIERTFAGINECFTQQRRGPYRNKDRSKMKTADEAPAAKEFGHISLPKGFTQSINGYVIKEDWKECFEFVCFSRVPAYWTSVFAEDGSLGYHVNKKGCIGQQHCMDTVAPTPKISEARPIVGKIVALLLLQWTQTSKLGTVKQQMLSRVLLVESYSLYSEDNDVNTMVG
ncbi:hypothetical protein SEMRO_1037_G234110.1 [Seminavis robusta]|uniref:Uncharacterized protein n=1 Tax=Seminavis robusta TaxID=568900 RepID=A0A9N8HLJ7_9STRA|nr:hypothetical protein SEMRO_1037_G234110.1 [Seminavis robusta]|eukprot:Sro1037_g234110.1 n/a (1009) ;mRNA; f:7454-10582